MSKFRRIGQWTIFRRSTMLRGKWVVYYHATHPTKQSFCTSSYEEAVRNAR